MDACDPAAPHPAPYLAVSSLLAAVVAIKSKRSTIVQKALAAGVAVSGTLGRLLPAGPTSWRCAWLAADYAIAGVWAVHELALSTAIAYYVGRTTPLRIVAAGGAIHGVHAAFGYAPWTYATHVLVHACIVLFHLKL